MFLFSQMLYMYNYFQVNTIFIRLVELMENYAVYIIYFLKYIKMTKVLSS